MPLFKDLGVAPQAAVNCVLRVVLADAPQSSMATLFKRWFAALIRQCEASRTGRFSSPVYTLGLHRSRVIEGEGTWYMKLTSAFHLPVRRLP